MTHFQNFFLTERASTVADMIYQKVLDNLDTGFVDHSPERIETHIGRLIKNSKYNVYLVIRKSDVNSVKLGKRKDDESYAIVVDVKTNLPGRKEIDDFLSDNQQLASKFKDKLKLYLEKYYDESGEVVKTNYEEATEANDSVDDMYDKIVAELKSKITEFREMTADLEKKTQTSNLGRQKAAELAIKKLAKDHFGDNFKEFLSKCKKEYSEFWSDLSKENRAKLESRLESFYDQKIKPLKK